MNIYEKLAEIQHELKAPKGQFNSFGNYKYRSCEDILEAVKPICYKNKTTLVLIDDVVQFGERLYVKATARLYDNETQPYNFTENTAFAREADEKKGMDVSQVTGTASSYARKYALNGLFAIDDTKDADTDAYKLQTEAESIGEKKIGKDKIDTIKSLNLDADKAKEVLKEFGYEKSTDIKVKDFAKVFTRLKEIV